MSYEGTSSTVDILMFDAGMSQLGWYYQYSCSTSCSPSSSNIFISLESQTIVVAMHHNTRPRVFELSLTDGSIKSTGVLSITLFTSSTKPLMTQFGTNDSQIIISYPYNTDRNNMIVWSTTTSSVISSHNKTNFANSVYAIAGPHHNGMLYLTTSSGTNLQILKFYYYDPGKTNSIFSGSMALFAESSLNLISSTVSVSDENLGTYSDPSISITDITIDQQSNSTDDIIYTNGTGQFHSVASGYNGTISFDYFCSKSGSTVLNISMYSINGENTTSWVSPDSAFTHLTISAPIVTVDTNFSFGMSYIVGSDNI